MTSAPLGQLADIRGGGTPRRDNPEYWNGEIPWATVKDFKTTEISETQESVSELGVSESATCVIPAGNIIIPTRMALGKVAINRVALAINQDLKALLIRDRNRVDGEYLFRFLLSKSAYLEGQGKGATVKGITLDVLRDIEVPLPHIDEQKRIAAILEKADAIRRTRQQAIQLADEFLRSVFLDMFGSGAKLPQKTLGGLTEAVDYGLTASATLAGNGPKFLRITDIQDNAVEWSGVPLCDCTSADEKKYRLRRGDIVFARTGATTGKSYLIWDYPDRTVFASYLIRVRPADIVDPVFLSYFFQSGDYWQQVASMSQGAAQPGINASKLKLLSVPVPPKSQQFLFRSLVEKAHDLTLTATKHRDSALSLFESLSQRAFRGGL